MKHIAVGLLLLTLTGTATAGEILIPVVNRGPGAAGSVWRTEIVVSNISPDHVFPAPVTITLHRDGAAPLTIQMPFSSKETLVIPDAVHDWFGLEQGGGIVRVTWDAPGALFAARARIYNVGGAGEYGQEVPGLSLDELKTDSFLAGLSGINGNRTNVGVSNPHETDALIWIWLYDTSGLARGGFSTVVPARTYRQFNDIFAYFQAGPLQAAMVAVYSTNLPVYAYGSVIRADTGDPTFVSPR